MPQLDTYLLFDGQCEEAFKFYAEVLGGKIDAITPFEGSPVESTVPAEFKSGMSVCVGGMYTDNSGGIALMTDCTWTGCSLCSTP